MVRRWLAAVAVVVGAIAQMGCSVDQGGGGGGPAEPSTAERDALYSEDEIKTGDFSENGSIPADEPMAPDGE